MPYPEILNVLASIETKFGGDISQWMSQLHKGINIAASDPSLKPLIGTDWRYQSGRLRFIDAQPTPNEIAVNVENQAGARTIDIPVLAEGVNIPVYVSLQQTMMNKNLNSENGITFQNVPAESIINRLAKLQQEASTVYNNQQNDFGEHDQLFGHHDLLIKNEAETASARIGYLGTLSHNFNIPAVGANSLLLAVSETGVADGDIFYWLGGKAVRLGIGTPGQILKLVSNVPTWQNEIAAAGLPSRNYFATDYSSSSSLGATRYHSISGDTSVNTTFNNRRNRFSYDIRLTKVGANIQTNSTDGGLEVGLATSAAFAASVVIPAATTGYFEQAVNAVIPAGTDIAFRLSTLATTTGTYEVRPLIVEYEVGSPGAFEDSKVLIKEIGASIGSVSRNINFSVGTDFDITENVGTGNYDIKIADNAIATNHIANAQVTLEKLATDSVDATKIAPAAVGADEIATGAVGPDELAANAVTTPKILDRNVTEAKLELSLLNRMFKFPFRRDWGIVNGRDPTADGSLLLNDIIHDQSGTGFSTGSGWGEGTGVFYGTTTTSGTRAGERSAQPIVMGSKNPAFFCRFSIGVITGLVKDAVKFFAGIMQSSTLVNSNDPLNNLTGIGIQARSSNTDFRICHNNGATGDNQVATGVTPTTDTIYTFYMYKEEGTNNWHWFIWASNAGDINTTPTASGTINTLQPTGDTALYACVSIINNTTQEVWINRGIWGVSQDLTGAA